MTQHTPGPWYATTLTHDGETYSHVQSASINEDNYVARVDVMDEQGEANAALIAAAPAMLEALKAVESEITRLERISKQAYGIDEVHPAVDRVAIATRAAIAAAEGRADLGVEPVERPVCTCPFASEGYLSKNCALHAAEGPGDTQS